MKDNIMMHPSLPQMAWCLFKNVVQTAFHENKIIF